MRGLWLIGATVVVIGVILLAIPQQEAGPKIVHEQAFVLTGESIQIVTLRLSVGEYEIWVKDIDGWQRENQFIGLDVLDSSRTPLTLIKDTGYTLKVVDNATIERHSGFSVEKEQTYSITAYTWDASHVDEDDRIYIKKLASDTQDPYLPIGFACLIGGTVLILISIRGLKASGNR